MEPSLGDSVDDITGIVDDLVEDDVIEPVEPEPNKVLRQEPRRRNDSSSKKQENLRAKDLKSTSKMKVLRSEKKRVVYLTSDCIPTRLSVIPRPISANNRVSPISTGTNEIVTTPTTSPRKGRKDGWKLEGVCDCVCV